MNYSATDFFLYIENQYFTWLRSEEQTKEITCQIEDIDLTIILNKGGWIYPFPNCPTPLSIDNTFNITSIDNDKIKSVFERSLLQKQTQFSFSDHEYEKFKVRFFSNKSLLTKRLQEEENANKSYRKPRYGIWRECTLI